MFSVGIDIGTTSTKAILFDENGKMYGKASKEYPINTPSPAMREQNIQEIFNAVITTLGEVSKLAKDLKGEISFVSFSCMMHSIIAVDENCNPLTECIIWADSRSVDYAEEYKNNGKGIELYKRTGTPCHPMSPLYKIMWIRDNQPEIFNRTYKFISIKEYILYKFFNEYIVDYSIASATGMFNIYDFKWDEEALRLAGIKESQLSKAFPTTYYITGMNEKYQILTGLNNNTVIVLGGSDGCLANLGSNGIEVGSAVVTIGTSGAIRVVSDKPMIDNEGRTFCYILTEDKYVSGGPINNGGMVYRWFRDNFSQKEIEEADKLNIDPYELINTLVENTKVGSDGLIFLPFLTGERAPYWNANLRGAFVGISDIHKRRHFARAIVEGISYAINDVFQVLKELTDKIDVIYVNGGFTKSKLWVQILCDILNTNIVVSNNYESPCLGAVMLGMVAVNKVKDFSELSYMLEDGDKYTTTEAKELYEELFNIYQEIIFSSMNVLEKLAHFQKNKIS
ncbi:gluconokinase [Tissierella praeacuta]|uniref:gluconokinase n=1 Tax=Tissierella praeacuta TaxID=43131 RepID=UPI002FDAF9D9